VARSFWGDKDLMELGSVLCFSVWNHDSVCSTLAEYWEQVLQTEKKRTPFIVSENGHVTCWPLIGQLIWRECTRGQNVKENWGATYRSLLSRGHKVHTESFIFPSGISTRTQELRVLGGSVCNTESLRVPETWHFTNSKSHIINGIMAF
jgi:hypothetical protein